MTAILKVYHALTLYKGGRLISDGSSMNTPVAEVTVPGEEHDLCKEIEIDPEEFKWIWEYDRSNLNFEVLSLTLLAAGYARVFLYCDTPEDPDADTPDLSPSGDTIRVREIDLSCKVPFILNTDAIWLDSTTVANEYQVEVSGVPKLVASATAIEGKIYKVGVYNTEDDTEEDPITIRLAVVN